MAATLSFRDQFREHWRDLKRGRPGCRFQDRYEHARASEHESGAAQRVLLLGVSILCLAIGVILSVIPGPAIPFFFLAGGLLATESRFVARVMDWCELRLRALIAWAKRFWQRLSTPGRVLVAGMGLCCAAAAAYLTYRIFGK